MEVTLAKATAEDAAALADLNQQLIADEAGRNPMSLGELTRRMREWLEGDWQAVWIEAEGDRAGYALFQVRPGEHDPRASEVYLRQLFIERGERGRSIGSDAVDRLIEECFPAGAEIIVDVLETNPRALQFWRRAGFEPYAATLRKPAAKDPESGP